MKRRFGHGLALVFTLLYASLGTGCFWRHHHRDVAYAEHGDRGGHEHERRNERR
jgi:hypothetical protein